MKKIVPLYMILSIFIVLWTQQINAKRLKIPKHPSKITYKPLDWQVPLGEPYRTTLNNGLTLYIAEDNTLPLVTITGYFKKGSIHDPIGMEGLGGFTLHLMRTGGTKKYPADTLDAIIDHYALSFSFSITETQCVVKVQFLSQYIDTALHIFEQILFQPAFEDAKISKEREIAIQNIQHRFDNPEPILNAAYTRNMYPKGANSRLSSEQSLKAIKKTDLINYHKDIVRTENAIFAISGNFKKKDLISKLELFFPQSGADSSTHAIPAISINPSVKFLLIHKKISQAHVKIGHPFFKRPHPDYYAMSIFNMILGGSSFTSRLGSKIRSDEGLTYSIYSRAGTNYLYPETFSIYFFTQHATVNKAIALTLKEVDRMLSDGSTEEELENAKKVMIESLPSMFRSKEDITDTYAWNEFYKRSMDHYQVYPEKIKALDSKEIQRASKSHLNTENFTFVIIGDTTELFNAPEFQGFSLKNQTERTIILPDMLYDKKMSFQLK